MRVVELQCVDFPQCRGWGSAVRSRGFRDGWGEGEEGVGWRMSGRGEETFPNAHVYLFMQARGFCDVVVLGTRCV
jgi:hypothetical protein